MNEDMLAIRMKNITAYLLYPLREAYFQNTLGGGGGGVIEIMNPMFSNSHIKIECSHFIQSLSEVSTGAMALSQVCLVQS